MIKQSVIAEHIRNIDFSTRIRQVYHKAHSIQKSPYEVITIYSDGETLKKPGQLSALALSTYKFQLARQWIITAIRRATTFRWRLAVEVNNCR